MARANKKLFKNLLTSRAFYVIICIEIRSGTQKTQTLNLHFFNYGKYNKKRYYASFNHSIIF